MDGESDDAFRSRETLLDLEEKGNYEIYGQFCIRRHILRNNRSPTIVSADRAIQDSDSSSDESESKPGQSNTINADHTVEDDIQAAQKELDVIKEASTIQKSNF